MCGLWPPVHAAGDELRGLLYPHPGARYIYTQKAFIHIENYKCMLFLHGLLYGLRIPFLRLYIYIYKHRHCLYIWTIKCMRSLHGLLSVLLILIFMAFCIHVLELYTYTQKSFIRIDNYECMLFLHASCPCCSS